MLLYCAVLFFVNISAWSDRWTMPRLYKMALPGVPCKMPDPAKCKKYIQSISKYIYKRIYNSCTRYIQDTRRRGRHVGVWPYHPRSSCCALVQGGLGSIARVATEKACISIYNKLYQTYIVYRFSLNHVEFVKNIQTSTQAAVVLVQI